ncbi:MAG: hypothetical protein VX822_03880 [Candidatus Neomarinimicrobiota bacterium]|nr:hypothetical protein [Candidatus Neomarinimicrobiota bacterium]
MLLGGDWNDVNTAMAHPGVYPGYKYLPSFVFKGRVFIEAFAGGFYDTFNPVASNEYSEVTLRDEEGEKQSGEGFAPDFNVYIGFSF